MASSPPLDISTKPKPRERPVSRSVATWARVTVPYSPNQLSRSSEVVWKGRFPTKMFLLIVFLRPHRPAWVERTATSLPPPWGAAGRHCPAIRLDDPGRLRGKGSAEQ